MLIRLNAATLQGVDAVPVTVEVRVDRGIHFLMVGLPDSAVRESQQRIKSAIEHLGYRWPGNGITINLAPAGLRKEGAAYDLPLALGILAASEQIDLDGVDHILSMEELALDGTLRPVRGGLALAQAALLPDIGPVILPRESATEAALLDGVTVHAADHLREVVDHLAGTRPLPVLTGDLVEQMALGRKEKELLTARAERFGLSARSHSRVLRLARTVADLAGAETVKTNHIAEARAHRRAGQTLDEEEDRESDRTLFSG